MCFNENRNAEIGNLSNPSINRWGLNLFWYNFWYTDKTRQAYIHQDYLINKLVYTYVYYGLILNKSIFNNTYWYAPTTLVKEFRTKQFLLYFRTMEFKSHLLNEVSFFRNRTKRKHLYTSKIWILRYQKWLIINFYSFQPTKTRRTQNQKRPGYLGICIYPNNGDNKKNLTFFLKKKYLLTYLFSFLLTSNDYYSF